MSKKALLINYKYCSGCHSWKSLAATTFSAVWASGASS